MFAGLFGSKDKPKERPQKPVKELRDAFCYQETDIKKLVQPCSKVHTYSRKRLLEEITDMFPKLNSVLSSIDKILDDTIHLPLFREKCRLFLHMGTEINEFTRVSLHNLNCQEELKNLDELIKTSEEIDGFIKRLDVEVGKYKDKKDVKFGLFNELDTNSFKISEEDLKKYLEETKEEKVDDGRPDKIDDNDKVKDDKVKQENDQKVMDRIGELQKDADKIANEEKKRDQTFLKHLRKGTLPICIPAVTFCYIYFSEMLKILDASLTEAIESKETEHLRDFVGYAAKMGVVGDIMYGAMKDSIDTLYYKPLDHEDWDLFFQCYDYERPKSLKPFMK